MLIKKTLKVATALLILGFVILVHEFGHFITCKLFNISTPTFSIGFGPALIQKQIGDTTFQIALIPLGGYVSMNAIELQQAPYWQKMIITLAGIFNNFLLAFLLLGIIFYSTSSSLPEVVYQATTTLWLMIKKSFYFIGTFFRPETRHALIGPIGIVSLTAQTMERGFNSLFLFIAAISVELGVFNVLPIPLLDGGQAFYYTLEAISGNSLAPDQMPILHFIYLLLLLILILYINKRARKKSALLDTK